MGEVIAMKVWVDQDLCTGCGGCEMIAPDVFEMLDDGLPYVKEDGRILRPGGVDCSATIPEGSLDAVIEATEECPGECIFIEA